MSDFFVYILKCADSSYYVGHTDNLEQRIAEHNLGRVAGYTARRRPIKLVYSQEFSERGDAISAERQIKGWGREKKSALIRGDWDKIIQLSNSKKGSNPSTSSGRTERVLSAAFTREPDERSGRTERVLACPPKLGAKAGSAAFTRAVSGEALSEAWEPDERLRLRQGSVAQAGRTERGV